MFKQPAKVRESLTSEMAEIRAAQDTRVKSKVEGRATLKFLIKEGVLVERGQEAAAGWSAADEKKSNSIPMCT